jgi:acyl-CoA synthetase (AMP-forming)/AMP-acid ligase II
MGRMDLTSAARGRLDGVRALLASGAVEPVRPDRLAAIGLAVAQWGLTPAAGVAAAAARYPRRVAIADEAGVLTYTELDRAATALAGVLDRRGDVDGSAVGLLARNSRDFVVGLAALSKAGADVVLLNSGSSARQTGAVLERERVRLVLAEAELAGVLPAGPDVLALGGSRWPAAPPAGPLPRPRHRGRLVVLTSGTTGTPKGAPREATVRAGLPAAAVLAAIPLRSRETTVIAAPLFHAWGLAHLFTGLLLGSTLVLHRRPEPATVLRLLADHRASALVTIPAVLHRLLAVATGPGRPALPWLRVVAVSGSALPGDLATRFQDVFGDVLHNLYGSTEAGWATVAGPADLRAAPDTAGRPLPGVRVRVVDERGRDVPVGTVGRVFVGSPLAFTGYTGGEDKERLDGLVGTGDLGRFDPSGRLFLAGRGDEMVVSGGENVYPTEVEDALVSHPAVSEAAVVGRPDPDLGARLVGYVVPVAGAAPDPQQLRAHVRDRLARHAVPREILVVAALPRNETGKIVKRLLPSPG